MIRTSSGVNVNETEIDFNFEGKYSFLAVRKRGKRAPSNLGVEGTVYVTKKHCPINLLFSLIFSLFCPFVPYGVISAVSSTPSKSRKEFITLQIS